MSTINLFYFPLYEEVHNFVECEKVFLKSDIHGYLQVGQDSVHLNVNGIYKGIKTTFILQRTGDFSTTLELWKSGKFLFPSSLGYELRQYTYSANETSHHFQISYLADDQIALKSHDNKFLSSNGTGTLIGSEILGDGSKWSFECLQG